MQKLSYKSLLTILLLLVGSIIFLIRINGKISKVSAAWPPARRASGSESGMTPILLINSIYYVYLLKSHKDKKYYIGQTNDINKRLSKHNSGQVTSTKSRIPFTLVSYETYSTRSESMWRESQLKKHSNKKEKFIAKLTANVK